MGVYLQRNLIAKVWGEREETTRETEGTWGSTVKLSQSLEWRIEGRERFPEPERRGPVMLTQPPRPGSTDPELSDAMQICQPLSGGEPG